MGFNAKATEPKKIPIMEIGTYQAVCYGVVDLGTIDGKYGPVTRADIFWEFPNERVNFMRDGVETNGPRVNKKLYYDVNIHDKKPLGKDLIAWRGKLFTPAEQANFDLFNVIGANCMLSIVHDIKGDKIYANVDRVSKLVKGLEPLKGELEIIKYSFADNGANIPEHFYDWLVKEIKLSYEYRGIPVPDDSYQENPDDTSPDAPEGVDIDGEDIPF